LIYRLKIKEIFMFDDYKICREGVRDYGRRDKNQSNS